VSVRPRVAIVGIGYSELSRDSGVGPGTLIAHAAKNAVLDSGLAKDAIDGVVGVYGTDLPTLWPGYVVDALGLANVRWWDTSQPPSVIALSQAAQAVLAGNCDYALCYHGKYRWATTSVAGRGDPYRQPPRYEFDPNLGHALFEHAGSMLWAARVMRWHMHRYGSTREDFARIAVNNRTHAATNPRAVFRTPLDVEGYLASPMVDDPMCLLDMDAPVDGAMAVVVTTEERARHLGHRPVLIESFASGLPNHNDGLLWVEADGEAARRTVQHLFARTDHTPRDVDLSYPYDGFSILTMLWLEALYTGEGGGADLIRSSWSDDLQQLRLFGRVPVCTHGGNLSEGRATQGFGHVLEATQQLRGTAGERQVPGDPRTAVITNGAAFSNRSVLLTMD